MGKRTDGKLLQQIERELMWCAGIPRGRVRASISDGVVTLDGEVEFLTQREDAGRRIGHLAGVRRVDNRIMVRARPVLDGKVRRAVERALGQHASREARHIDLVVVGGTVKMSGRVGSATEKELVVGAARGTEGVVTVEDNLRVAP